MRQLPNWKGKTILIVEDEEVARFFFKTALDPTGASLLFAVNGAEGVQLARDYESIDCILMDIRLPIMDGYEATRIIKEYYPKKPLIVQTAYVLSNERNKAFDSGCDDFVSKPVILDVLYKVLEKYLG
jgi:two-component system, cell cycle response regulator DivK